MNGAAGERRAVRQLHWRLAEDSVRKSMTNRHLRLFLFGVKIGVLLLSLLAPPALWYFTVFQLGQRVGQITILGTGSASIIGIFGTERDAKVERDRQTGRSIYKVDLEGGHTSFVLTNQSVENAETLLLPILQGLYDQHPDVVNAPPRLLQGQPPLDGSSGQGRKPPDLDARLNPIDDQGRPMVQEIVKSRLTRFGQITQLGLGIVASVICFALYFPIGSALISLLRRGTKQLDTLPNNKALEPSAPRRD